MQGVSFPTESEAVLDLASAILGDESAASFVVSAAKKLALERPACRLLRVQSSSSDDLASLALENGSLDLEKTFLASTKQDLHDIPELAFAEVQTSAYVQTVLAAFRPDELITRLGGTTGLLAVWKGAKARRILFRAELDAVRVEGEPRHYCGHDAHMTMLLALARRVASDATRQVTVGFVFQPAEETGEGAQRVVEHIGTWDAVYAMHNMPSFPPRTIAVRTGVFTASVCSVDFALTGKASHAAAPHLGINPADAIADVLLALRQRIVADPMSPDYFVSTTCHVHVGREGALGSSPAAGRIQLTWRAWSKELLHSTRTWMQEQFEAAGLKVSCATTEEFASTRNADQAVQYICSAAETCGMALVETKHGFQWGEDYGIFTDAFQGAMFGFGTGGTEKSDLHMEQFVFPEDMLAGGVQMYHEIIKLESGGAK